MAKWSRSDDPHLPHHVRLDRAAPLREGRLQPPPDAPVVVVAAVGVAVTLLATLGLSSEALAERRFSIGGSDANTIMSGDPARIVTLWREKRGEFDPASLADILAVQMGSFTEPLNAAWFTKMTGLEVFSAGERVSRDWDGHPMTATLDGLASDRAVFEAKHVGTRSTDAEVFARYVPQLTHNCLCADRDRAWLSVFKGNGDWCVFEYALDDTYAAALVEAEARFWRCVETGEPPHPLPEPPIPPKPVGVKEYDMAGSNAWASHAADYFETVLAADRHEQARKELKLLVPADASKAFGHGLAINRDKRGALRFANTGE